MLLSLPPVLAILALILEACAGYPPAIYSRIGHPVTWIGRLIAALDRSLNRETAAPGRRRLAGLAALAVLILAVGGASIAITALLSPTWLGGIALVILAASLPAQRSLHDHVAAVADALESQGLDAGRAAVGRIVGRNTAMLDEAGVARAAIESLAENFSDGVVAPVLWTAIGGLPGGALYKAVNTADSMIGHRTPRHEAFGWAAARLDDLVNLPASRLSALWLLGAALILRDADAGAAARAVRRDARHHRSPNAGWPEAAMAGALGLALAGPRQYGDRIVEDALMGDGRRDARAADIRRALRLYRGACLLQALALAGVALAVSVRA